MERRDPDVGHLRVIHQGAEMSLVFVPFPLTFVDIAAVLRHAFEIDEHALTSAASLARRPYLSADAGPRLDSPQPRPPAAPAVRQDGGVSPDSREQRPWGAGNGWMCG
jgi:hypothetical protein